MQEDFEQNAMGQEVVTPKIRKSAKKMTRRDLLKAGLGTAAVALSKPVLARPAGSRIFRIHPAIGVARVGNLDPDVAYFIGPEIPGMGPLGEAPGTQVPNYKVNGQIKPQAARFRIFEYAYDGNGVLTPLHEVTLSTAGISNITWKAHLANRKASFHQFYGPHGESLPALPLRNAAVADRKSLETDFGPLTIAGASQSGIKFQPGASGGTYQETWPKDSGGNAVIDYLGQLRTDTEGRLILLGGKGKAASNTNPPSPLPTYANNDGWFDDVSDGPVTAVISLSDGTQVPVDAAGGAWALVAPPDFAPQVESAVSQYDLHFDLAMRTMAIPVNNALYRDGGPLQRLVQLQGDYLPTAEIEFPTIVADFDAEIRPILLNAYKFWWVTHLVTHKHDSLLDPNLGNPAPQFSKDRQGVFVYLRPPGGVISKSGSRDMPRLLGDDPYLGQEPDYVRKLTLTRTQFGLMRKWMMGAFNPSAGLPGPATITPHGLDKAALENCVGGAFFPGIEASWQIRNQHLFIEPFRLNLNATSQYLDENGIPEGTPIRAGHFSRQMAVPWHADFNDCRNEGDFGWWPAQRPDDVYDPSTDTRIPWARPTDKFLGGNHESTHDDMQQNWYKFGFVIQGPNYYSETERSPQIP